MTADAVLSRNSTQISILSFSSVQTGICCQVDPDRIFVHVMNVLEGSWDLVSGVINKVTILTITYNST